MATKSTSVSFVVAQNSAIVLNPTEATEMTVRGLQGMGLCLGFTMSEITVSEMGKKIATKVFSGGEYEVTSIEYNFIPGDPSLEVFQQAALNATNITDIRLYVKTGCDFSAPDLISDTASGLRVGTFGDPSVDSPNGLWTGSLSYSPAGAFALFIAHTGADGTTLSYVASTRTLSDSASGFVTNGFEVGDTCILDDADSMVPKYVKITSVAAGAIVFTDAVGDVADIGDFSGATATKLHGATPMVADTEWSTTCD